MLANLGDLPIAYLFVQQIFTENPLLARQYFYALWLHTNKCLMHKILYIKRVSQRDFSCFLVVWPLKAENYSCQITYARYAESLEDCFVNPSLLIISSFYKIRLLSHWKIGERQRIYPQRIVRVLKVGGGELMKSSQRNLSPGI